MILLEKVRWMNFLSTGNIFNEINLSDDKMTLIAGNNGSGKSTFMDALCFALFNKPFRKINKPQLINTITNKNLLVEVEFKINKKRYLIKRGIKPNIFEIYVNDVLINQSSASKDYQNILEQNILKMNYKTFCQIVIIGSANFTPFMQLSPAHRREIIEDLLDIQVFSIMNTLLKAKTANNKQLLSDNDTAIKIVENTIKINGQHALELEQNNELEIKRKNQSIQSIEKENGEYNSEIDTLSQQIELKEKEEKACKVLEKIKTAEDCIRKIDNNIRTIKDDIDFYQTSDNCNVCKQSISNDFKQLQLSNLDTQLQSKTKKLNEVTSIYDSLQKTKEKWIELNKELVNLSNRRNEIRYLISSNNKMIESINNEIIKLNEKRKEKIKTNEKEKKTLVKLGLLKEKLLEQREMYNVGLMLLKDSGIKSRIIKQYIPIINKLINKYLDQMEFFCQFEIDENFNEVIKSGYRDELSYNSFSQGEKMRLDLAMLFTWREVARMRNSASVNLLVLDEIMDSSLDASGTDEFLKIIQTLATNNNIFIISHKHDQIADKFDNSIMFIKEKNFSKMVIT